jgi:hypothetical protein
MSKAYHFTCQSCSYSYTGPIGHVHAKRDQVVSVLCPGCQVVEARRINWTQIVPYAENISDHLEKLQTQAQITADNANLMENMLQAAGSSMEWNDYSLQLEDIFVCWSCEEDMYIWDTPVCPCCGDKMQRDFSVSLED